VGWRHHYVGREGDQCTIANVKVWQQEWRWLDSKTVRLPNPLEPGETESHMICEVGTRTRPVRFAAAKLPSRLWSFYVPD
jgi:hypothetical protein